MEQLYTYLPGILLAYSAFLLGVSSPGPNVLAVISTSMSVSRKAGISLALGVATGSFIWAMLTALGLSALLTTYAAAIAVTKIVGGLYLFWLAYKAFKSAASAHNIEARALDGQTRAPFGYALRGYIIQMTNPKAALTWIAIIALGLQPGAPLWVAAVIVIGTFMLSIVIHVLYAVAFSTPIMVTLYGKASRFIQATLGVFFVFTGFKLLTSRS
ncbi:LysE family transporter [uncultured Roseobacter sp.]|uniref:LysE family translocator n=1 Tax=uncultured Roseobacter sp. TaxID=114847 RepID=UPI0026163C37|nr:LysE family transporter [uncultured Roseobacter sp.]